MTPTSTLSGRAACSGCPATIRVGLRTIEGGSSMNRRRCLLLALPGLALLGAAACANGMTSESAPRPLRYVAIGASDSAGVGANVPDQESWPAVLQRKLPAGSR